MGKKPFTRFVVDIDGELQEVLKIRDLETDIILLFKQADFYTDAPYAGEPIHQQRYSIHPSRYSDDDFNELKQTIELKNGTLLETSLRTKAIRSDTLQLIFAHAPPPISNEKYTVRRSQRDRIIEIERDETPNASIIFSVFVTSLSGPTQVKPHKSIRQVSVDFKQYRIIFVYSYLPFSAGVNGHLVHSVTNTVRKNKGTVPTPQLIPPKEGETPESALRSTIAFFILIQSVLLDSRPNNLSQIVRLQLKKLGFGFRTKDQFNNDVSKL